MVSARLTAPGDRHRRLREIDDVSENFFVSLWTVDIEHEQITDRAEDDRDPCVWPSRIPLEDLISDRARNAAYPVPFVNAAAWLIPGKTMREIGGFDPVFFHRGEDNNFVDRIHHQGLSVCVSPKARVHHNRPQTLPAADVVRAHTYFCRLVVEYANPRTANPAPLRILVGEGLKLALRHLVGGHFGIFRFDSGPKETFRLARDAFRAIRHLEKRTNACPISFLDLKVEDYLSAYRYGT